MNSNIASTSPGFDMPWLQGNIDQARETVRGLVDKVNQAYETGELDTAEVLDGKLESLYEFLEHAFAELEEDGQRLSSDPSVLLVQDPVPYMGAGDSVDTESSMTEYLADAYNQMFVNPPSYPIDYQDKIGNLRGAVEEYGGTHDHLTDEQVIEAAKDAYENIGRTKALSRPPKNPAFEHSLTKAEAILKGGEDYVVDETDDPSHGPGLN